MQQLLQNSRELARPGYFCFWICGGPTERKSLGWTWREIALSAQLVPAQRRSGMPTAKGRVPSVARKRSHQQSRAQCERLPLKRQEVKRERTRHQQHVSQRSSASNLLKHFVLLALSNERARFHQSIVNALLKYLYLEQRACVLRLRPALP